MWYTVYEIYTLPDLDSSYVNIMNIAYLDVFEKGRVIIFIGVGQQAKSGLA